MKLRLGGVSDITQVKIWKSLSHPNVLELLGACSFSDGVPFFVSPYMKNGNLIAYLRNLPSLGSVNPLKLVHEIALGMAYLHSKEVLHGNLKVNDEFNVNIVVFFTHETGQQCASG